jgi:hypothetical protein
VIRGVPALSEKVAYYPSVAFLSSAAGPLHSSILTGAYNLFVLISPYVNLYLPAV